MSFVTFSQSDSEIIICPAASRELPNNLPPKRIEIELVRFEEVNSLELIQKEKDSLFNLYKVKMISIMEDSIEENDERIMNTQYVAMINPIEISPEYPGGELALKNFIDSSFVYPSTEVPNIKGTVYVDFVIDTLGQLDSFKVMKGLTPLIDLEVLRVVESFPNFSPCVFAGRKKAIHYTVPVKVNNVIYISDPVPYYPGGVTAMHQFIQENFKYPKVLWKKRVEATIWTKFLVNKDGSISNIEVVKGVQSDFDAEALRVFKLMPNWIPAQYGNGTKTAVYMTVPIKIEL